MPVVTAQRAQLFIGAVKYALFRVHWALFTRVAEKSRLSYLDCIQTEISASNLCQKSTQFFSSSNGYC